MDVWNSRSQRQATDSVDIIDEICGTGEEEEAQAEEEEVKTKGSMMGSMAGLYGLWILAGGAGRADSRSMGLWCAPVRRCTLPLPIGLLFAEAGTATVVRYWAVEVGTECCGCSSL